jgi:hypothetical protein
LPEYNNYDACKLDDSWVSIIEEVIDANTVKVYDSEFRDTQGLTLDPVARMINDTTSDETLRNRYDELIVGALRHRFCYQMPNVNIGEIVPGFMITAIRNQSLIHYCQISSSLSYLSGYYLPNRQISEKIKDSIQTIKQMPNKAIVWCKSSTWQSPVNEAKINTLPQFGEAYATLFFDLVDASRGITDMSSIEKVHANLYEMILSDNSVRQFNSFEYGEDFSTTKNGQDIIKKDLKETWGIGLSFYDDKIGHIFWRVSK